MRIFGTALARFAALALLGILFAGPVLAQFNHVEGEVFDLEGKPFPEGQVVIIFKHRDSGQTLETKPDKKGQFIMNGLRIGQWMLQVMVKGQLAHERDIRVGMDLMPKIVVNFKDLLAKQTGEEAVARKKQDEEGKKFEGLKAHFDAGRVQLDQAIAAKNELLKLPVADRGPLSEKLAQTSLQAITEFEAAKAAATEKDPNLNIVMYNLGQAYDMAGRYDEAVAAYIQAIELKGDVPGYYQALGTAQARAGKVTEAMATCEKSATLPTNAAAADAVQVNAGCYGNIGIILQNAAKMKESIDPLRKATVLNPNNPDYWFLLGRGLVNAMEYKTEGGTMKTVIQPGTAEAYQKYLELAPTGRFAQDAKDGLAMLETIAPGIQTKYSTKKPKKP